MSSTFDALGRLSTMTTGLGQFNYTYHSTRGLLQTVNLPNGEIANYTYYGVNGDLRLNTLQRKLDATELFYEKYTYADNGNQLTRLKRSPGTPAQTLSYTYDSADQLLSVSNPKDASNYPQSYAYDPAGNLSTSGAPAGSRTFSSNSLNERTTDAGIAQQFDANGNLSTGMGYTLAWDAEDRLKSISYNGTQKRVEYDYDGLGRRVRIRSMDNGVKTAEYLYVWDGLKLCEKRDSAVDTFPVSIYFPQGERKFLSGTYINYFYLRDRLGSVRGATSDAGSIIQNSDYPPYGPSSPQQPAVTDPDFGFTGHLKCPFTGLTLAPYRVLGYANWLSRDPIGETGGLNLYGYVGNSPVNRMDPLGLYITYAPGDYTNWNNQFATHWQNPAFQNRWNQMQNSPYDFHYSPNNIPDRLTSISGSGNLRVDDDGTGPSHGDPHHQNTTSMRRNGRCLNADTDPYLVAPLGLENFGVRPGNPATMTANGQSLNAPIGDFGPAANGFGEASVAAVHGLGLQTVDVRGVGPVMPGANVPTAVIVYPSGPIRVTPR